jgi:hypothetical protein
MDATALADHIAPPISKIGMAYYFSPQAKVRAEAMGTNAYVLYAAGRGGVLGDVEPAEVERAFHFFSDGMILSMIEEGRTVATPAEAAHAHLDVATEFARASLEGIPETVLRTFCDAAAALARSLPTGRWPLVDGYLALETPSDPDTEGYYWAIVLRELRCSVHIDATIAAGLSAAQSCQLDQSETAFALHGYGDGDRSEETDELIAARRTAERETTARMAELLEVLCVDQRLALGHGVDAMAAALSVDGA